MVENCELQLALNLPIDIVGFYDGKPRKCYAYTLENINKANGYLSIFGGCSLNDIMNDETMTTALYLFLVDSFRVDNKELEDLLENITDDNFDDIISDIKACNGITDDIGERDISSNAIQWNTAVSAIVAYTAIPLDKIKDLTLIQFNDVLEIIGKKINWEYKTNTITNVEKPNEYITQEEHPLHSEPKVKSSGKYKDKNGHRVMTMKEAMGLFGEE